MKQGYNQGDFLVNKKGLSHTVKVGEEDCLLIVFSSGFPY